MNLLVLYGPRKWRAFTSQAHINNMHTIMQCYVHDMSKFSLPVPGMYDIDTVLS